MSRCDGHRRAALLFPILTIIYVIVSSVCSAETTETTETGDRQLSVIQDSLNFGFLPVESPVTLFKRFAPMRDYVATHIDKPIRLETAKDFSSFNERVAQRHYDIVFTAPHLALLALDSKAYEVAAVFVKPLRSAIVVKAQSEILDVKMLEGKIIATPPGGAIVTMVGIKYLQRKGLHSANYKTYQSHNAAYTAVAGGEADAAIVANFMVYNAIAKGYPLKIIQESEPFPGIGILVASDLTAELKQRIKKTFREMKDTPDGQAMLATVAQPGYTDAQPQDFEILRPYLNAANK